MEPGDEQDDRDTGIERRISAVPTFVWMMLGALLVLVFIGLIFFVFHSPPSWKATHSLGPPQAAPSPRQHTAPSTPTPAPRPSDLSR